MKITEEIKKNGYTFYENQIIESIDLEPYGARNDVYLYDKIKTTYNIFKMENGFMIDRVGQFEAFKEWLMGLPSVLTVSFEYYKQIEEAKEYGLNVSDDDLCNNWFDKVTEAFFTLKDNL